MCFISQAIETSSRSKSALLKPLVFKIDRLILMDKVIEFLNANDFAVGEVSKEFSEIYAESGNREYTFSFTVDSHNTILNIVLFTEHHKLSNKKHLLLLIKKIKEHLGDYLF